MSAQLQSWLALGLVGLAVAFLARAWWRRRQSPGCGSACGGECGANRTGWKKPER